MTTNQEGRQDAIRSYTSSDYLLNGDWHALFDLESIPLGTWNERMLAWINSVMGESYTNLMDAMSGFAIDQGFTSWSSMSTFVTGARITLDNTVIMDTLGVDDDVGNLAVVNGSGTYLFSITADPDSKFQLNAGDDTILELSTDVDYQTKSSHTVTIEADNGIDTPLSRQFTIMLTDNTAPAITSSSSPSVAENAQLSHSLTADESVTWSITGGVDQGNFELSGSTLRWLDNGTKDYEAPTDADLNNTYIVQVTATDTSSNTTNQVVTVTVTNVADTNQGSPMGLLLALTYA